jgi:hypothetical protein
MINFGRLSFQELKIEIQWLPLAKSVIMDLLLAMPMVFLKAFALLTPMVIAFINLSK